MVSVHESGDVGNSSCWRRSTSATRPRGCSPTTPSHRRRPAQLQLLDLERVVRADLRATAQRLFVEVDVLGLSAASSTPRSTTSSPPPSWSGSTAAAPRRTCPAAPSSRSPRSSHWSLPAGPDGAAPPASTGTSTSSRSTRPTGWWGGDASAPQGLGGLHQPARRLPVVARRLGAVGRARRAPPCVAPGLAGARLDPRRVTAVVIVGTANHWVIDAVVGWLVVGAAWAGLDQLASPGPGFVSSPAKATRDRVESGDPPPSEETFMRSRPLVAALAALALSFGMMSYAGAAPGDGRKAGASPAAVRQRTLGRQGRPQG